MSDKIVQIRNSRTNRYAKVDMSIGIILPDKKTKGSYKKIPIMDDSYEVLNIVTKDMNRFLRINKRNETIIHEPRGV